EALVPEPGIGGIRDRSCCLEPPLVERESVQIEEPERDGRMILEIAGDTRDAGGMRSHDATIVDHLAKEELAVPHRECAIIIASERSSAFRDRAEKEAIPCREDLLVATRPLASGAAREQHSASAPYGFGH